MGQFIEAVALIPCLAMSLVSTTRVVVIFSGTLISAHGV